MFRMLLTLALLSTSPLFAKGYWVSSNVSESPQFPTPEEACSWYLDTVGYDLIGIEYQNEKFVYCIGFLRDQSRILRISGVIGMASFLGDHWDRAKYESDPFPFCVGKQNLDAIRKSLADLYGEQVQSWTIGSKMLLHYSHLLRHAQDTCKGLLLVPSSLILPQSQLRSYLFYVLKNVYSIWDRQSALEKQGPLHLCLLASALSLKTEFALTQLDDKPLNICSQD